MLQGDWTEWVTRARMADLHREAERERLARQAWSHQGGSTPQRGGPIRRHGRMSFQRPHPRGSGAACPSHAQNPIGREATGMTRAFKVRRTRRVPPAELDLRTPSGRAMPY